MQYRSTNYHTVHSKFWPGYLHWVVQSKIYQPRRAFQCVEPDPRVFSISIHLEKESDFLARRIYKQVGLKLDWLSKISNFVERIQVEHIELICSLGFELTLKPICSIWNHSRKQDFFEKPTYFLKKIVSIKICWI